MRTIHEATKEFNGQTCIWLQSYGYAPAKPAQELKVGDIMIWNFGTKSRVDEILKSTAKTITIKEAYYMGEEVKYYERKLYKARFVAISNIK